MNLDQPPPQREVFSVSALNEAAREMLEHAFPLIWVEGEISNLARPSSGHLYFSLKDAQAQVRCAMFRQRQRITTTPLQNGAQVLVRARLSLYTPRGDYQLIVEHLELAGEGALRRQFDVLKARLSDEGLFAAQRKRPLPTLPQRIGVITSPSGAAIRDILSVLARRFPAIPVLIYPVPVQGSEAPAAIVEALRCAGHRQECDVLILARGGGSLEDLWAFNNEAVARAIHACPIPVITGIGHEIDFTIADFVADHRAPTPSAAAELVSPDRHDWLDTLLARHRRLQHAWRTGVNQRRQTLQWLRRHLLDPGQQCREKAQRLDDLDQRLRRAQHNQLQLRANRLSICQGRLWSLSPERQLEHRRLRLDHLQRHAAQSMRNRLQQHRQQLRTLARTLEAVSPLATLNRGYAMVQDSAGALVSRADQVAIGDSIQTRLAVGRLDCRVEAIHPDADPAS